MILHYERQGSGTTVLLLHGYLSDRTYWNKVVPELSKTHEVISMDLLGFGKSPKPRHATYDLNEHVGAVYDTLQKITDEPIIIVGHSMGSLVAAQFSVDHADAVTKTVLCNMPFFPGQERAREAIKHNNPLYRVMLYSPFARLLWPITRLLLSVERLTPGPSGAFSIHHSYASRMRSLRETIEPTYAPALLAALTKPTILINGRYDRRVYPETLTADPIPTSIEVYWAETGHHTPRQIPKLIIKAINSPPAV